jgi:uncharacterized membrane protein
MLDRLRQLYQRRTVATFVAAGFATVVCFAMIAGRIFYTETIIYAFLVWNLFLAWIPFLISFALYQTRNRRPLVVLLAGAVWLAFFPNAPYIVTDLIHLQSPRNAPIWFDAILLASFAWTGLFLGLVSLRMMQSLVRRRFGTITGWCFAAVILCLSSFGVYLGRFQRWNSWDIVTNPVALFYDIADKLLDPLANKEAVGVTLLFTMFLAVAYIMTSTLLTRQIGTGEGEL